MFSVKAVSTINQAALEEELRGENGSVGQFGQQVASRITSLAKSTSPVLTGELRASISTRTDRGGADLAWVVVARAEHAQYVEEGYYHNGSGEFIPGRHFIQSAVEQVLGSI